MKLYTEENTELMEVTEVIAESGNLVVVGTIMGAMPVRAVLSGGELRKAIPLLRFRVIAAALKMLLFK